jgi:ribosomal protein L12E/L44/L45/RPP1/RPP2
MKKLSAIIALLLITTILPVQSQNMNNSDLEKIIYVVADSLRGNTGNWQFMIKDRILVCITDEKNNRMRIMSPIVEQKELGFQDMLKLMEANFHTALDVKYAISDEVLWSVFIHPLKQLDKDEVLSAINQVYAAAVTYGTTYNSTGLVFPKKEKENTKEDQEKLFKKKI